MTVSFFHNSQDAVDAGWQQIDGYHLCPYCAEQYMAKKKMQFTCPVLRDEPMTLYVITPTGAYLGVPKWMIESINDERPRSGTIFEQGTEVAFQIVSRYESNCEKLIECLKGKATPALTQQQTMRGFDKIVVKEVA